MKFKSISQTVPQSVQVLFKVKWETDMYQALQDGGGMWFYNYIQQEYMCNTRKKQGVLWHTYSFFS